MLINKDIFSFCVHCARIIPNKGRIPDMRGLNRRTDQRYKLIEQAGDLLYGHYRNRLGGSSDRTDINDMWELGYLFLKTYFRTFIPRSAASHS